MCKAGAVCQKKTRLPNLVPFAFPLRSVFEAGASFVDDVRRCVEALTMRLPQLLFHHVDSAGERVWK